MRSPVPEYRLASTTVVNMACGKKLMKMFPKAQLELPAAMRRNTLIMILLALFIDVSLLLVFF